MKGTISEITEPFQNRTAKSGKPYSAAKVNVLLETGEMATGLFSFRDLAPGSEVQLKKNDAGYWNIISEKEADADAQHEEIMNAIRALYKLIQSHYNAEKAPGAAPAPKTAPAASTKVIDEVFDVNPDEPINLDDIPF